MAEEKINVLGLRRRRVQGSDLLGNVRCWLEYVAIIMLPMLVIGLATGKGSQRGGGRIGCLTQVILPVFQLGAMAVFVLTLSPIILGFGKHAAWSFPWKIVTSAPGAFLKLVGVLVVAAIIWGFIPLVGQIYSLQTLFLGGITLIFALGSLESVYPGVVSKRVDPIPDFWFVVGILVISGFMSWISRMISAVVLGALDAVSEGLGQTLMLPVGGTFGAICGFIPVFMYGAWLGARVKGGF